MTQNNDPALIARKTDAGIAIALEQITDADLPEADVAVDVTWSSLIGGCEF